MSENSSPTKNSSITTTEEAAPCFFFHQHFPDGRLRFAARFCHHNAFAGCQAIRFDDNGNGTVVKIFPRRLVIIEDTVAGRGNTVFCHQPFSKRFAPFNFGSLFL